MTGEVRNRNTVNLKTILDLSKAMVEMLRFKTSQVSGHANEKRSFQTKIFMASRSPLFFSDETNM